MKTKKVNEFLMKQQKGALYNDVPTIQAAVTQGLMNISKAEFKKSVEKLVDRFKHCIELNESYFE